MKRIFFIAILALSPRVALAQSVPPSPKFVPWTMSEQDNSSLTQYLNSQPFGVVAPIVQFLGQHEQAAQEATKKATEKDADPVPSQAEKK